MRSVVSVFLVVLVAGGCSDSVGPGSIAGKWAEDFSYPGSSFEMDLVSTGSTISGNGSWCGEAGPCGIVTVSGTITGIDVHLNFASTAQFPQVGPVVNSHFDGRLTSLTNLRGAIVLDAPNVVVNAVAEVVTYHRAN
jgi:hypothetical protein